MYQIPRTVGPFSNRRVNAAQKCISTTILGNVENIMLYNLTLNFSHVPLVQAISISALFVVLSIIKEKKNERKRA